MPQRGDSSDDSTDQPARKFTPELIATAYHEAGHAVMAIIVGRPIEKVTIVPAKLQTGGGRLGQCKMQKGRSKPTKDAIEDDVLILLAGMVAESHATGHYSQSGAGSDLRMVERILSNRAKNERQLERMIQRTLDKTEHLLADDIAAKAIALIARDVLERETISGRAVRHLYDQAEQQFS